MFYAYFIENTKEKQIVDTWEKCQNATKGKKARFKKFKTYEEANKWLLSGANYEKKIKVNETLISDAVYFDAGTGRGIGVEARITDVNKNSLLSFVLEENRINQFGNLLLEGRTNNFGELSALFFALKYALKYDKKFICGDSELVIKYWVNKHYNKDNIDADTITLIEKTNKLYEKFIANGGKLVKISGDINPSDLGFHK